ncbi:unnamed protein product [Peronospora belbahrii]|uniref:Uncharacterized protein n=1 Tax=Peronospora belbahrii TaxID=622444 RepID=A0AAU9L2K8_9STRA|nr:unnamed protein product [Peronospora belbahrii]CAH0519869.1 unnamed protein product [Peronospora belbahrii]
MGNLFGCYKTNKLDTVTSPTSDGVDHVTKFDANEKKQRGELADHAVRESNKSNRTEGKREITISNRDIPLKQTASLDSGTREAVDKESGL